MDGEWLAPAERLMRPDLAVEPKVGRSYRGDRMAARNVARAAEKRAEPRLQKATVDVRQEYKRNKGVAIRVPKVGHTKKSPGRARVVSRSTKPARRVRNTLRVRQRFKQRMIHLGETLPGPAFVAARVLGA